MLQGPHGPCFARLANAIRQAGHDVHRINFNGGDRHDWTLPGAVDFRGRKRHWPAYFADFVRACRITDLLVFGDCRPFHATAYKLAQAVGIRVHVLEEGYLRPDFVTLEEGGVNGHSSLPTDPQWYLDRAAALPFAADAKEPVPADFRRRVAETFAYTFACWASFLSFPFYRTHRPYSIPLEASAWALRYIDDHLRRGDSDRVWNKVKDTRYFVLPLQLNSDYQLRIHSSFTEMRAALHFVVEDFARCAPAGTNLLIKRHPLDPGIVRWQRIVRKLAREYNVEDRIFYMRDGDIDLIVADARGVVTVNSTVGTLALNRSIPVTVLGGAVYKIEGIVDARPLAAFWNDPIPPCRELYDAFRRVLINQCLIRGGFCSEVGLTLLVQNAMSRLLGVRVWSK